MISWYLDQCARPAQAPGSGWQRQPAAPAINRPDTTRWSGSGLTVLHLRSSSGLYGAEQVVLGLTREQVRRGIDSSIVAFAPRGRARPELLDAAQSHAVTALPLECRGPVDARSVAALRRLLLGHGVDLLHCHDYKSVVYARLATQGLPVARVATLHGWLGGGWRLRAYRWLELRALRGFDRVCAVSSAIENDLLEAGLPRARIRRIDNGVDTRRFRPSPRVRGAGPLQLGVAARLSPEKNLLQLVEAVAACRQRGAAIELDIVGDGPLQAALEQHVQQLGVADAVRLRGRMGGLERWYPGLDAFVLPSLTEGMPITVLEAMACGCPVVASAVGSIPMLLAGLPHSRTVPPGDLQALVAALLHVQALEAPRQDARDRVRMGYSLERMDDEYARTYAEALSA